ncbi:unnamed protein product [Prorocentrum cordatum]|uniref:Uncharacterized protein n=1 Tax=Prorocentrum cordatum TaxID=2364126 RepID=A0ABN9UWH0_9DINO|nr:unnamed protein product [Polarella glacialis]
MTIPRPAWRRRRLLSPACRFVSLVAPAQDFASPNGKRVLRGGPPPAASFETVRDEHQIISKPAGTVLGSALDPHQRRVRRAPPGASSAAPAPAPRSFVLLSPRACPSFSLQ